MKNFNKIIISLFLIFILIIFSQKKVYATVYTIRCSITGDQEVPASNSTGVGALTGTYNDVTYVLTFSLVFTGLTSNVNAAHFHGPASVGVIAPVLIPLSGFPIGVTSGSYANSYLLTAAQNTQIIGGLWYVNIHTTNYLGGEIRGQLFLYPQNPTYNLSVKNFQFVSLIYTNDAIEFDIYMQRTGNIPLEYAAGQYFFNFNHNIFTGTWPPADTSEFSYSIIGSDLPLTFLPVDPSVGTASNPTADVMKLKVNLFADSGVYISNTFPGTKIVRMRLWNKTALLNPVLLNLQWRNPSNLEMINPPVVSFATNIFAYVGGNITEITSPQTHLIVSIQNVNLKLLMEAMYSSVTKRLSRRDTVTLFLRNAVSPYELTDSAKSVIDSVSYSAIFTFYNSTNGQYYLVAKHHNCIETWSKAGGEYIAGNYEYSFFRPVTQAYGNNMVRVDAATPQKYAIYSGDINHDGTIDLSDGSLINNDAFNFASGYVLTDVNGDGVTDLADAVFADNNGFNFVSKITP